MPRALLWVTLARFSIGACAGVLGGLAARRLSVLRTDQLLSQWIGAGILLAGMLALVRLRYFTEALLLVLAYGLLRFGLSPAADWTVALAAPLLGLGALLVALIFDLLAQEGIRFGKFLVIGPLLGGVFLSLGPIGEFYHLTQSNAVRTLMAQLLLGLIIGESVALGVEVAELLSGSWKGPAGRNNLDQGVKS